jgi:hypothetical protein
VNLFRSRPKPSQSLPQLPPPVEADPYLDAPLFSLSRYPEDAFTLRQAVEGVLIMGGIGSGKSSGSGKKLLKKYLLAGLGGLVLTAKPEEAALWLKYTKAAGREGDVIVLDESGAYSFNFLRHEMKRPGRGAGYTENVVRLFANVAEAIQGASLGRGENAYWFMEMMRLLRNAVDLLYTVRGEITVPLLQQIVRDAPTSIEETWGKEWQAQSEVNKLINEGDALEQQIKAAPDGEWRWLDYESAGRYFMREFPQMGDRQRSSIVAQFMTIADMFTRRPFRQLFCGKTNVIPEMTREGKIIILDLPVKEFGAAGRAAQVMFKYMWQQAVERDQAQDNNLPAVFCWLDEAQNFISEYDAQFLSTARSSRACAVYISQNLPNYYAYMGGDQSEFKVDSLVGNFATKIWHANSDPKTNEHAAQVIGKAWQTIHGDSESFGQGGVTFGQSASQHFEYEVPPQRFTTLKKGGPPYGWNVEGIVFQNGRIWEATGKTYLASVFGNKPE